MTRKVVSFLVGMVLTTVIAVGLVLANPEGTENSTPGGGVWLWRAGMHEYSFIHFAANVTNPDLGRASDGSLFVFGDDTSSMQRFDPDQRRFESPTPKPSKDPSPKMPADLHLLPMEGTARMWVEDRSDSLPRRTFFYKVGTWLPGPTLAAHGYEADAFSIDGDRSDVVYVQSDDGIQLFVAQANAPAFAPVALHGKTWSQWGNIPVAVAIDGTTLYVLSKNAYGPHVTAHIIDTTTGEITEGPHLGTPFGASDHWSVSGAWVPGGGALLLPNGSRSRLQNPGQNAAGALLLLVVILGVGFALRAKKLSIVALGIGFVVGIVPLALLAWEFVFSRLRW